MVEHKKIALKVWVEALRLRSLPLSVGGALVAAGIASLYDTFRWPVFILMLVGVLFLQVLANFADEYGDLDKGADNDDRVGPIRGMQRGEITRTQMKRALIFVVILCCADCIALLFVAFGLAHWPFIVAYLVLAALCVGGAICYTVGSHAYGYHALGDISCFFFFGIMSVSGGFVLYALGYVWVIALPSIGVGLLVTAMININNMRDLETDRAAGKNTFAVLLGERGALVYHFVLVVCGLACMLAFPLVVGCDIWSYAFVVFFIPLVKQLVGVAQTEDRAELDRYMKPHSLWTALLCAAFALCIGL